MATPAELLAQSLAKLRTANRIDGTRASYRKDNPGEYVSVMAYLDGGPRPSNVTSDMGMGLMLEEDARRALGVVEPPPPPPTSEPAPIAGQGYTKVFEDDFDTLDTTFWRLNNWYLPEEPTDVTIENGCLVLHSRQSEGYPHRGVMTREKAWQFGYFEAKIRYTHQPASFPGFWMMSDNWIRTGNCQTLKISEWDIFEAFPTNFPRSHSGALHRNTTGACGLADAINSNWTNDCGRDLGWNWRIYSGLWTPSEVRFYVDEVEMTGERSPVFSTTNQPMRLFLQINSHGGATGPELRLECDWVRVWQK